MKKIGDFGDHGDVAANGYCIDPDFLLQCGPGYEFRAFFGNPQFISHITN